MTAVTDVCDHAHLAEPLALAGETTAEPPNSGASVRWPARTKKVQNITTPRSLDQALDLAVLLLDNNPLRRKKMLAQ
jgi:hypothetical protein